jgi:hypothetical protein
MESVYKIKAEESYTQASGVAPVREQEKQITYVNGSIVLRNLHDNFLVILLQDQLLY